MQDSAISDEQGKQLNAILDGASPYDDGKYKDLVEKTNSRSTSWRVAPAFRIAIGHWTMRWAPHFQLDMYGRPEPWAASTFFTCLT
jgi:hypothetical protein